MVGWGMVAGPYVPGVLVVEGVHGRVLRVGGRQVLILLLLLPDVHHLAGGRR